MALFMLTSLSCKKNSDDVQKKVTLGKVFRKGMTMTVTTNGKKDYTINADALIIKDTDDTFVHGEKVKVEFFNPDGYSENTVTADTGKFDIRTKNVILIGNVILTNIKENTILHAAELQYDAVKKTIISNKPVQLEQNGSVLTGDSLETDLTMKEIRLTETHGKK